MEELKCVNCGKKESFIWNKKPLLLSMDIGVWLKEIENVSLQQSAKPLQTEIITINAFLA